MFDTTALRVALPALWERARLADDHTPPWLHRTMARTWGARTAQIWDGDADAAYGNDDSVIDMALASDLIHNGLTSQMAAEAVMCRRLRVGRKVEKVDPAVRTDYLVNMIAKIYDGRSAR
jgi:hypothetical protein